MEENARKAHHNVRMGVFDNFRVLAQRTKYLSREAQKDSEWDEQDDVDSAATIKVHSAQVKLASSKSL